MIRGVGLAAALTLFLVGAVCGALGLEAYRMHFGPPKRAFEKRGPGGFIVEHMTRELDLSAQQTAALTPLVQDMLAAQEAARSPCRDVERATFEAFVNATRALLTPAQQERHKTLVERIRLRGGPPPHGAPGFPPPPPPDHGPGFSPPHGPPPPPPPRS